MTAPEQATQGVGAPTQEQQVGIQVQPAQPPLVSILRRSSTPRQNTLLGNPQRATNSVTIAEPESTFSEVSRYIQSIPASTQKPITLEEAIQRAYQEVEMAEAEIQDVFESIEMFTEKDIPVRFFKNPEDRMLGDFFTESTSIINDVIRYALDRASQASKNPEFSDLTKSAVELLETAAVGLAESAELGRLSILAQKHSQNSDHLLACLRLMGQVKIGLLKSLNLSTTLKNKIELDLNKFPKDRPGYITEVVQSALYAYYYIKGLSRDIMPFSDKIYNDIKVTRGS